MDRNRNRRKGLPSDENIVISLEANQKRKVNINDEDYLKHCLEKGKLYF